MLVKLIHLGILICRCRSRAVSDWERESDT